MKLVKLSVFALTMGLFVASCGNGNSEAPKADTTVAPAAAPAPAPAAADTTAKPAADAKATEPKKDEKKK